MLVEFALVSLVLYLLVAGTLEFGRATFGAQLLQDAARLGARELALTPRPPTATFAEALPAVFDPGFLVIDLAHPEAADLDGLFARLPVLHQALRPLMIVEQVGGRRLLRYPGALIRDTDLDPGAGDDADDLAFVNGGFTVLIPRVVARGADGVETIEWLEVVEEVQPGAFPLQATGGGLVGLRIHYPFQAAALSGHREGVGGPLEPNGGEVILADDAAVTAPALGGSQSLAGVDQVGVYGGAYGLGKHLARGQELRPFRRLLSAQSLSRREVFE